MPFGGNALFFSNSTPGIKMAFEPSVPQLIPNALDGFTAEKKNVFLTVTDNKYSTFGLDVDTASYSVAREYIKDHNQLPPLEQNLTTS